MSWIKIESSTPDKPEVLCIADALDLDPDAVFGKLVRVWIWADHMTEDGVLDPRSMPAIDRVAACPGFADALVQAGWLAKNNGELAIPNFDRHNGESAKKRALAARRNQKYRLNKSTRDADSVTETRDRVTQLASRERHARDASSVTVPPTCVTQSASLDKIREDKSILPPVTPPLRDRDSFAQDDKTTSDARAREHADARDFAAFLRDVLTLRDGWEMLPPNGAEVAHVREIWDRSEHKPPLDPETLALLRAYLNDRLAEDSKGVRFFRPEHRESFTRQIPGMITAALRWKKETRWRYKPADAPAPQPQPPKPTAPPGPPLSRDYIRSLLTNDQPENTDETRA